MKRTARLFVAAFVCAGALPLVAPQVSMAAGYPTNACVSKKTKATGKYCASVLKAWSKWHKDPSKDPAGAARDASILKATEKLSSSFTKAETTAAKKGTECVETTATAAQVSGDIETAIDALEASLGTSVDAADQSCRSKVLGATAKLCQGLLYARASYISNPGLSTAGDDLDADQTEASTAFTTSYDAEDDTCTTAVPSSATVLAAVDEIDDDVAEATTTSPNLPLTFAAVYPDETVTYLGKDLHPRCSKDTPYRIQYKRGTENKLLMFYMGGGACWSSSTCWTIGTYTPDVDNGNDISAITTGFADPDNVLNIFREWHVVFVSYCTGDVHWGENDEFYGSGQTTLHRGRVNAAFAEKWAREHFLDPEFVFVTGSSAGSYGAIMNSTYLMDSVYPQVEHAVLGDAGIGVITQPFLEKYLADDTSLCTGCGQDVWGISKNLPTFIPGISLPVTNLSMPDVITALAAAFPENRFASYESAYDGGDGGQTSFYHIMKNQNNILDWPNWHEDQCEWTACMRQFSETVAINSPNYRYYTGAGSRHTIYGSDKVYTDTRGLVPPITFRDWIDAMINDDVGWVNLDCQDGGDCDLVDTCQGGDNAGLPCDEDADCTGGGDCEFDPRPSPLAAPYEPGGVVNCPVTACPCGPTGVNCP